MKYEIGQRFLKTGNCSADYIQVGAEVEIYDLREGESHIYFKYVGAEANGFQGGPYTKKEVDNCFQLIDAEECIP